MPSDSQHIWHYRGRRLRKLEWGLWRDLDRPGYFFLCYRPQGSSGPVVRRWARIGGDAILTVDDLKAHVRRARSHVAAAKLGVPSKIEATWALGVYLQDMERRNLSEQHIYGVRRSCETFIEAAAVEVLDQIDVQAVEAWLHALHEAGRSPRTLNKHRAHLSGWLSWAMQRDYIAANPAARVGRAKQETTFKSFPEPEQMVALVDASEPYDAALWTFLLLTGLRLGSFLGLGPGAFRDDGIVVRVTKRRREWWLSYDDGCPLWGPELSELGRRIWAERLPTRDYIQQHLEAACRRAREAAVADGQPDRFPGRFTPHAFRHGFCSWLALMGEALQDIAAWAHHARPGTTEVYAHLRPHGRNLDTVRTHVFTIRAHCLAKALQASD